MNREIVRDVVRTTVAVETLSRIKTNHYRADIDGLRALAVIAVVLFHAFPDVLKGGFVGVDIFFVISGFLITSIIIQGLDADRFSFFEFYARRIKRIFPALILVLTASLALGWFVLLADEYRQLGKHVAAGAGFLSNFIFWREANYFDSAADTKILLHLWSLAVEEQYYFIWPALVWAAWKKQLNLLTLFCAVYLISFYTNVHTVRFDATQAFYSPLPRFWELVAGGLLAYLSRLPFPALAAHEVRVSLWIRQIVFHPSYGQPENSTLRDAAALTGAAMITASVLFITQQKIFPGWWALLPTTGAWLLLFAGQRAWFNRAILSSRFLVWLGLISYPLYLWHWPLFAFARNILGYTPSAEIRSGLIFVSVALAWLTYRMIEMPIRFGSRRSWTAVALCSILLCVGGFGYYDYANEGLGSRLKDRNEYGAYFESYLYDASKHTAERAQIAQNQCNFYNWKSPWPTNGPRESIDDECYTKHSKKSVLILGDSIAADLYYGLKEVLPKDISTLLIFSSGCTVRPIVVADLQADHCNMTNYFALNQIKKDPPDIVLMSSNNSFSIDYLRQVVPLMKRYGVRHVFVLGQRPHWKPYLYKIIIKNYWYSTPRYIPGHQDTELLALGDEFKSKLTPDEPFEYIDQHDVFCTADGCLTYLGDDRRDGLITFDDAHLRPFASVYLAKKQLVPLILNSLKD